MRMSSRHASLVKIVAPIVAAVVIVGAVGGIVWGNSSATQAANNYHQHRQALTPQLRAAPPTATTATPGVQRYAGQIHDALISGLPAQAVIVSFQAQHLWAYQNGQVVLENAVTTGIRGVTDFGTDFGPMKVVRKAHPWTMHSPWPKGSQYYYPDTVVQWTTFFTNTGEAIHDASWEPASELGPGSQYNASTRSHGCIHLPMAKAQWMFSWAPVGMPVIVYPGDGSPVANQLSQITTDDQGN